MYNVRIECLKGNRMESDGIRINKFLSEAGVCSRRNADTYIDAGRVWVNGVVAEKGTKVSSKDVVTIDNKRVVQKDKKVILAFNKPSGLVCSTRGQGAKTVLEFLQYPIPLFYVGRLDKNSEGLLLLTNDGDLANAISKARNAHEKEYEVIINKPVTDDFLRQMAEGIPILGTMTRKCKVWKTGKNQFAIILTQGLNRQIRRMCEYCGCRVKKLKRVRIMNIELGNLEPGTYRELEKEELTELQKLLNREKK